MGKYTVIAEVSQSILALLRNELSPELIKKYEQINLCNPSKPEDVKVGIHLYDIQENSDFVQRNMIQKSNNELQFPPQSLTLYYLITVYSTADRQSKAVDEQRILGRVMQILGDHPRLENEALVGSLQEAGETFEIIRENMPYEDKIKLWQFPNTPYQLSMVYKVQPVRLESTKTKPIKRVKDVSIELKGEDHEHKSSR
ncbi:DUF4255 domain-containing protein [Fusibacter ferrireducens]|uniref:DUF4255 domain-containing protein n=1 Tax=Fusibacter ferrireducens TaxID=2785058 RepID=A0ABR9ZPJ1_9FIRM|nr:DUF4255 domain-containing protein [Fusibacter ferrireducens]MBF4692043.1 DUF4255 domain-containing protein [Fusibacter ferrireducens]